MADNAKNLLLAAASTLLFLGLLELGSRWLRPTPLVNPLVTQRDLAWQGYWVPDRLLFWRLAPNRVWEEGPVRTNRLGLRGPEVPPASPDEFRILSLGESSTFARRLPYEATYSARIEAELGRVDGRRVRVINAGVPGYTLLQAFTYLEEHGLALKPDAVLLYFGYNDFLSIAQRLRKDDSVGEEDLAMTDRETLERRRGLPFLVFHFLARHSNLFRVLARTEPPTLDDSRPLEGRPRVPESDRRWLLEEIRRLCAEEGIRLVVLVPWYRAFEAHAPLLREFATSYGIPLVDLPRELRALPRAREEYFFDALHPTAEGHEAIARVVARALRRHWDSAGSGHRPHT